MTATMTAAASLALASAQAAPPQAPPHARAAPQPEPRVQISRSGPDQDAYRTVVVAERLAGERQRQLDRETVGFATAIDPRPAGATIDAVPELLQRSTGVSVRSVGGLGQFSSVSIRGSSSAQVGLFIDNVPITDSFSGLTSIADLPPEALEQIDVYRGHVPVAFGGAAMGGVLHLMTRDGFEVPELASWGGYGSFRSRQAGIAGGGPVGERWSLGAHLAYAGSNGDFPFFDDNSTPQTPNDDGTTTRTNNDYDRVLGHLGASGELGRWRLGVRQWVYWKNQGIPGPANAQSHQARLQTLALRTSVEGTEAPFVVPSAQLQWVVGFGANRRLYTDPDNEVGVFKDDEETWSLDGYISPRLRLPLWRGAFIRLVADLRPEWVKVTQREGQIGRTSGDSSRVRVAVGGGIELEQFLLERRLRLVGILRVDAIDSRFAVDAGEGMLDDQGDNVRELGLSPRAGLRVRIVDGVELRGSGGRYFRAPTMLELFGDRGFVVGNEGLRSETGLSVDGGLVVDQPRLGPVALYGQVAGFAHWSHDLIQWVQAGTVTRPINIAGARVRGLETALTLTAFDPIARLTGNYTLTDTINDSPEAEQTHEPLPGRARHEAFGKLDLGYRWSDPFAIEPRVFYTVEHIAGTYLDPSGRRQVPARTLHGLGVELHLAGFAHVTGEIRNIADLRTTDWTPPIANVDPLPVPISDFIGYPLPGRSFWVTLRLDLLPLPTWRHDPPNKRPTS